MLFGFSFLSHYQYPRYQTHSCSQDRVSFRFAGQSMRLELVPSFATGRLIQLGRPSMVFRLWRQSQGVARLPWKYHCDSEWTACRRPATATAQASYTLPPELAAIKLLRTLSCHGSALAAFECHPISRTWSFDRLMLMPSIARALHASWAHVRGDGLPDLSSKRFSRMLLLKAPTLISGLWRFAITERCTLLATLARLSLSE